MNNKGKCGDDETVDSERTLALKYRKLASLLRGSKHCVVLTGAGISTSSGIPDFRGPNGVWTRELKGLESDSEANFDDAQPSFAHCALKSLIDCGIVQHVISQNVDGLHLKSGISCDRLAELHGNIFIETCDVCKHVYFRERDVGGMGLKHTGNVCSENGCVGNLRDWLHDWDSNLPATHFDTAEFHLNRADLVVCIGTSLRIFPAANLPLLVLQSNEHRREPGKIAIINLQRTELDSMAAVALHQYCDVAMKAICEELGVAVATDCSVSAQEVEKSLNENNKKVDEDKEQYWTSSAHKRVKCYVDCNISEEEHPKKKKKTKSRK